MALKKSQIALNAIQWINLPPQDAEDAVDGNALADLAASVVSQSGPERVWLYDDPEWRSQQPIVHQQVKDVGFDAVMMEVLTTQTLQNYKAMLDSVGLRPAPGYVEITQPSDLGRSFAKGSAEWVHHFDHVRRRAEETTFLGLESIFLAARMQYDGNRRVSDATAVGAFYDQAELDATVEYMAVAAEVLRQEGVRAGLHNHVGTRIETEAEIDYVLANVDDGLLGASLDIGHLAWTGADYRAVLRRHRDRLVDLHIKDLDLGIAAASRETQTPYFEVSSKRFFLEPGLGELDLDGVLEDLDEYGFDGWVEIEVDRPSMDPYESAKVSSAWAKERFTA
ncbi:sugar phosphate isomerase/epimerase family protein [Rhodococcus koreensis]